MSDKKQSIGALWLRDSQNGTKYMSGVIEIDGVKHSVVVFKNNYKQEDKHPDYRVYLSDKQGQSKHANDSDVPF